MYNCIAKAFSRTMSSISVNFSSNDNTVRLNTGRNNASNPVDEPAPLGAMKSTSSKLVTSTPKNTHQQKRHFSSPHIDDCYELTDIKGMLGLHDDETNDKCVAQISGDVYQSFNEEDDVFSATDEHIDDQFYSSNKGNENIGESGFDEFIYDDYYWEDDILDYIKPEVDECSNVTKVQKIVVYKKVL